MKISITGATGFVGKYIAQQLKQDGHHIIAWMRNAPQSPHLDCRHFDLNSPNDICLDDTDVLIHCAAYLPKSFSDMSETIACWMQNAYATQQLLQQAEQSSVKTFIYFSSGQIYDWGHALGAKETASIDMAHRAVPYLMSKADGDTFVRYHSLTSKMRTVILRPSSVYGPGIKESNLLPRLARKIINGEKFHIKDIGGCYDVDLVHVEDVAQMTKLVVDNNQASGIYNVGGGLAHSTTVIIRTLCRLLDKPLPYEEPTEGFMVECSHSPLDISRARGIGYKPRRVIEDGITSYVESL